MKKQTQIDLIENLVESYNDFYEGVSELEVALGGIVLDNQMTTSFWTLLDKHINLVAKVIGNTPHDQLVVEESISWYIYENDCGKSNYRIEDKNIASIADLVESFDL